LSLGTTRLEAMTAVPHVHAPADKQHPFALEKHSLMETGGAGQ
jgi:hypothetical protein